MRSPPAAAAARATIDLARLRRDVEALATIGRTPTGGISRPAFSPAYEEACAWLVERMRQAGLETRVDLAGNVVGRLGPPGPAVLAGSHIDTVPDGGPLDGALGVLAALECARAIREAGVALGRGFEVVAFADEEGRYLDCLGSRAMAGQVAPSEVRRARDPAGRPLADAMRAVGLDPVHIGRARRSRRDLVAYLELHIEQGPVLEQQGVPVGVVEDVIGIAQTEYRFAGQADHAGTTPMATRRDAFLGAAEFAVRARDLVLARGSRHARLTFGVVEVRPQVPNIVPAETRLRQELREIVPDRLARLVAATEALATRVAHRRRLGLVAERLFLHPPVRLSPRLRGLIAAVARGRGLATLRMPSGAGHDAQIIAAVTEAGMVFVPSEGGRSHRPDEWTPWPAIRPGVEVLLDALVRLLLAPAASRSAAARR